MAVSNIRIQTLPDYMLIFSRDRPSLGEWLHQRRHLHTSAKLCEQSQLETHV
jgi:hypothetical protein